MLKIDVHESDKRLIKDLERLEEDRTIPEANKRLIKKFAEFCFTERISKSRISRYVETLHKISRWLGKKGTKQTD
jgi:hypothetical protein